MSGGVIQNFRGARALVVHPADLNRETLAVSLRRLGLLVAEMEPAEEDAHAASGCDLVFFDADQASGAGFDGGAPHEVAAVAMIGSEAPGPLGRVVRRRACAYLLKPVKTSCVFTAVFIAMNEAAVRRREAREREALTQRLAGRRLVTKAVLRVMAEDGVDDDEAYRALRRESMRRRLPIEEIARDRLAAPDAATGPGALSA